MDPHRNRLPPEGTAWHARLHGSARASGGNVHAGRFSLRADALRSHRGPRHGAAGRRSVPAAISARGPGEFGPAARGAPAQGKPAAGARSAADLRNAAVQAARRNDLRGALAQLGSSIVLAPRDAQSWLLYARLSRNLAGQDQNNGLALERDRAGRRLWGVRTRRERPRGGECAGAGRSVQASQACSGWR